MQVISLMLSLAKMGNGAAYVNYYLFKSAAR